MRRQWHTSWTRETPSQGLRRGRSYSPAGHILRSRDSSGVTQWMKQDRTRPQRRGRIEIDPDQQEGKAKPGKGSMVLKDGESGHRREEPGMTVDLPSPRKVPETSPERDGQGERGRDPGPNEPTGLRLKDKRKRGMDPAGTDRITEAREAVHRVERTGGNDGHTTPMGRTIGVGEAATTRRGKRKGRTKAKGRRARERETRPEAGIAEATEPGAQQQQTEHERTDRRAHSSGEGEEGSG